MAPLTAASGRAGSTVRVTGPQGVVAAVPQILGFVPQDSVVLLCLSGPRHRVGPAARTDIFPPRLNEPAAQLARCARRYADAAFVLCYHDGERPACVDTVVRALERQATPVAGVLSVSAGLIRDARSRARMRRDPGIAVLGPEDPQCQALSAASALAGRRVLPDRAGLVASIAPPDDAVRQEVSAAITRSHERFDPLIAAAPDAITVTLPLSRAVDRVLAAARAQYASTADVSVTTAADLIVLTIHVGCRDRLLARCVRGRDGAALPMLISIARRCPTAWSAEICAVLAAAAYRHGDGALAHCALDRVQAATPDHRLGRLLRAAIDAGLPPGDLEGLTAIDVVSDRERTRRGPGRGHARPS